MTFREAFLIACAQNPKATKRQKKQIARIARADPRKKRFGRLWTRMQKRTEKRYLKDTGKTVKDFGDGQFLDWLIENLPKILELIMKIMVLFGV